MKLTKFKGEAVKFIETIAVCDGVECDTYIFVDDAEKDLGIVRVAPHHKTPRQRILLGDKTVEGYIDGKGSLIIEKAGGGQTIYNFPNVATKNPVEVKTSEIMQWSAGDSVLTFYEICWPPYKDGRYENLI
jgi:hypothetical protein